MAGNWAGTHTYGAARLVSADSVDAVQRLVAEGGPVHALGTRHSFTDLPDTEGTLIDVSGLVGGYALHEGRDAVTVAAGTRYGVLASWLEAQGLALANLGSLPHISVGGAIATGTHGSGDRNGVLATSVRALQYVGADAEVHEVRRDDPDFPALAVGLGAFGVTTAVTLDVRPSFRLRQDVYTGVRWAELEERYDEVTAAGYSVSVFSRWLADEVEFVWVKTLLATDDDPVPGRLLGGVRVTGDASPLSGDDNVTPLGGVPGPWAERLPHFRLDRRPSFGDEIQSEYFVARADAPAALAAVRAFGDDIRPHLLWTELRTAAADDLWLSAAHGRDAAIIHFTWRAHPEPVAALIGRIEEALAPFDARPHWGKAHAFDRTAMERVHPRLADARAIFERLDPEGRFANAHLVRVGVRDPR